MFNRLLVLAGIATLGAFMGALQPAAVASPVPTSAPELSRTTVLSETLILACEEEDVPASFVADACTTFLLNDDLSATCFDGDIAGTYSVDQYRIEADTDGEGFYLVVWR